MHRLRKILAGCRLRRVLAECRRPAAAAGIPLIIVNFDQLFCLINLINWWNYYTRGQPVYVVDSASHYQPLLELYRQCGRGIFRNVRVARYAKNDMANNLTHFLRHLPNRYYAISNPDIAPGYDVPENFLEIFKHCIEHEKFHHVGFNLNLCNLPDYNRDKASILRWERSLIKGRRTITYAGQTYEGMLAPIDLTFAMYCREPRGWEFPHRDEDWNNALRLFEAEHLGWFIHPQTRIEENINYFTNCIHKGPGVEFSPGINNYNPFKPLPEEYARRGA